MNLSPVGSVSCLYQIYKRGSVSDQTDDLQGTLDLLISRTIALEPMQAGRKQIAIEVSKWHRLSAGINLVLQRT
jgi:hypothetical protein